MMRIICCHKAFIHDQFRIFKPPINLAIRPLSCGFARRTHILIDKISSSPFDCLASRTAIANIAFFSGICATGIKTLYGIERKRQGFIINRNFVNRILCRLLVERGNCQNRIPHIMGIICQNGIVRRALLGHLISRQDTQNAFHFHRFRRIDIANARMGHCAQKQATKHHAFGAKILCVFRLTRNLCRHIWRRKILANQLICHLRSLLCCAHY